MYIPSYSNVQVFYRLMMNSRDEQKYSLLRDSDAAESAGDLPEGVTHSRRGSKGWLWWTGLLASLAANVILAALYIGTIWNRNQHPQGISKYGLSFPLQVVRSFVLIIPGIQLAWPTTSPPSTTGCRTTALTTKTRPCRTSSGNHCASALG